MFIPRRLIVYGLAALIAIVLNIGTQWVIVQLFAGMSWGVYFSILMGTAVGLVAKYVMDKVFVFEEDINDAAAKQFILYSFVGVFTTLIFWGIEIMFHLIFQSDVMRYIGGVIGLIIGYTLKYTIDSRYVFNQSAPRSK